MTLAALLLGVLLSWDAPTTNCDLVTPLTDLGWYVVPVWRARIGGWIVCDPDDPSAGLCPVYERKLTRYCVALGGLDCAPDHPFPCLWFGFDMGKPNPGPGEVLGWLPPEAIDAAGNTSELCRGQGDVPGCVPPPDSAVWCPEDAPLPLAQGCVGAP